MRKRSKYRPKPVYLDPLGYVLESLTPMAKHGGELMKFKIRNHAALAALTKGEATRADIDILIAAVNMTEALFRLGFGADYSELVTEGLAALRAVGARGAESGRFVLRSTEMAALNLCMELHDAQLDVCVVKDIERGVDLINKERAAGRMTPVTHDATNNTASST